MSAHVGSIPLHVRIRIEAGIGNSLTDIGHADIDMPLPVKVQSLDREAGVAGVSVVLERSELQARLTEAVAAFQAVVTASD